MNIASLSIGDYVLIQSSRYVREHATITGFTYNNTVIVRLTDGRRQEFGPEFILKNFGQHE